MNLHSPLWRVIIIILLNFSNKRGPLLPGGCQRFVGCGSLTVEPAPLFLLGSNLTLHCHIAKCQQRSKISLELNGETLAPWGKVNSTTVIFNLFNVWMPLSIVRCKLQGDSWAEIVGGLDLQGGLPPDKPKNIICETSRSSDFIECAWERGQETHLKTAYNISVSRANGTQVLLDHIEDAEEITLPRAMIDEDTQYQLIITAYNHFGASRSDPVIICVKEIVIPETPHIMQMESVNKSIAVLLHWKITESSEHLSSCIRLRTDNGPWKTGKLTELRQGLIQVEGLKPLTYYEFQMRTCNPTSGQTPTCTPSFTSNRSVCSKWSPSVRGRSPGKAPSEELHVWTMLGSQGANRKQMVTALWKPPPPEDYSGEVQHYQITIGNERKLEVACHPALNQCSFQVPAEVQALSIRAVTLYGASPPANVPLTHSGDFGPVLRELVPSANGSAVLVAWSWLSNKHWSAPGGELLHYVLQWTTVPEAELQWQKLPKHQNSTSIIGLTAGVRYNISLYAVTTRGVSAPSSGLIYSKEQKPVSGPSLSVLLHEERQIYIQWDELPVNQQRGFITNYTIYVQTLNSRNTKPSVMVSGSDARQKWLDCHGGALALQVSASTSAGEGPRGNWIFSQPKPPAVGLEIVIVFIIIFLIVIITNLMFCSCVRERIKRKCTTWRPAWFHNNLPKLDNSVAIRLLEDRSELAFSSSYSDPPLSPISLISQEDGYDVYPNMHFEICQAASGQSPVETPFPMSDPGTVLADSPMEHVSYKPQIAMLAPDIEDMMDTEEEERDVPTTVEEDRCSSVFEGLLEGFLSNVEVNLSGSPLRLTLGSVCTPLWPETPERTRVSNGGVLLGRKDTENNVEADSPSLDPQQGETMPRDTADTACLSQYTAEALLSGGYFPQAAAL
uniref:interleukin-23 receptor isoform X2 n=1 Tax=Scatophagus argus TaxID=75038 RepID=UPI001ED8278E|nr:interleukin-23 receptor isoform X2 [Scatophagus argus]